MLRKAYMDRIARGSHVTLNYRLSAALAGEQRIVVDTFAMRPVSFQVGAGQLAAALEQCLLGLGEGDQRVFELAVEEAYGQRVPELVQTLDRAAFAARLRPGTGGQPGDEVSFEFPRGGHLTGVVKRLDDREVVVDFNHPLAGLGLRFEVRILGVL